MSHAIFGAYTKTKCLYVYLLNLETLLMNPLPIYMSDTLSIPEAAELFWPQSGYVIFKACEMKKWGLLAQKLLRVLRWWQRSIKLNVGPF